MTRHSYHERDYAFGQVMLRLRTSIGLTQAGLAERLGVSRRAVGEWEAGSNYPKAERLQHFVALCVQQHVFAPGREEEEIRTLWKTAHQRELLDETWLSALLSTYTTLVFTSTTEVRATSGQTPAMQSEAFPRIDWTGALDVSSFGGREVELAELSRWILQERCRMVAVLGMGGIGKSALVSMVGHQFAKHFDAVLWRSLRDAPSCDDLVADCITFFSETPPAELSTSLERRIDQLVERLQRRRCLLVLDNLESLLDEGDLAGSYRTGYAGYGRLIQRLAESAHQSCVLLTSREKPREISSLEGSRSPVHSLHLAGVDEQVAQALLLDKGLVGEKDSWRQLTAFYAGNPLALKIVAQSIVDLFGGDIAQFLQSGELVFNGVWAVLHQQVKRLTPLEQVLLTWLALVRESISIDALLQFVIPKVVRGRALEALEALQRRSLLERGQQAMFTLQSVVMEFVTNALIEQLAAEIRTGELEALRGYALEQAQAKDYVREIQVRLLVRPLLERLRAELEQDWLIEEHLLRLLDRFRSEDSMKQGYGPANVISLLIALRGDLHGLDLSRLSIRGAYLQGIHMQDVTLAGAHLHDVVFTDVFDVVLSVAVSPDGRFWAVGSNSGQVRVWREHGRTAHLMLRAHTDRLGAVAFGPDGRTLASASWDGTIKLWDAISGEAIATLRGHDNYVTSIAFSPGGRFLGSGSYDGTLRIWDVNNGTSQQILREHRGPILSLAWSPDGRLLASGGADQKIRLWDGQAGLLLREWHGHRDLVTGLAFAPDNTILASCGLDETVKLWEAEAGICRKSLQGHQGLVTGVAWSPDGRVLASCGYDTTIRLWDPDTGQCQHLLQGHTDAVLSLAFPPGGGTLLSSSSDRTLREWETTGGQCLHTMQGDAVTFFDVSWSPDGGYLASGASDATLTVWSVAEKTPVQVLHGHTQLVYGVSWSPDGSLLGSSSWDQTVRIWDMRIGVCVHILQGHLGTVSGIAWHPDGRLLASGGNDRTVRVWDVQTGVTLWVGHEHGEAVNSLSWSPDGTRLASGSDDHSVLVWRATDGNVLQWLHGHEGPVRKVIWRPDGTRLASCGGSERKGELFVWDTHLGTCVWRLKELDSAVFAVAWGPEGNLLIGGRTDGMLRWRDAEQGRILATVQAHDGWVRSIQVSPDGRMVASSGEDGLIKLWDIQSRGYLSTLRGNRPYERLTITGVTGLTAAQKATLRVLGAVE